MMRKLLEFKDDPQVLGDFYRVKQEAKARLVDFIKESTGVEVSTEAILMSR